MSRPADIYDDLTREQQLTFLGLFAGAQRKGSFWPDGVSIIIGKREAEEFFPEAWDALVEKRLITYRTWETDNHPQIGGKTKHIEWQPTHLGLAVREDELKRFKERMDDD